MIELIGAFCTTHDESRPLQHNDASRHEPPLTPITKIVEYINSNPMTPLIMHIIFACFFRLFVFVFYAVEQKLSWRFYLLSRINK